MSEKEGNHLNSLERESLLVKNGLLLQDIHIYTHNPIFETLHALNPTSEQHSHIHTVYKRIHTTKYQEFLSNHQPALVINDASVTYFR
jgi:hypothetical protein